MSETYGILGNMNACLQTVLYFSFSSCTILLFLTDNKSYTCNPSNSIWSFSLSVGKTETSLKLSLVLDGIQEHLNLQLFYVLVLAMKWKGGSRNHTFQLTFPKISLIKEGIFIPNCKSRKRWLDFVGNSPFIWKVLPPLKNINSTRFLTLGKSYSQLLLNL